MSLPTRTILIDDPCEITVFECFGQPVAQCACGWGEPLRIPCFIGQVPAHRLGIAS